jgi:hypothetical protein
VTQGGFDWAPPEDEYERDPLDYYPTPLEVTAVMRDWLMARPNAPRPGDHFLDPSIGEGHIVLSVRERFPASTWHGIEIDAGRTEIARGIGAKVINASALDAPWAPAHAIENPPFSLLDDFWQRTTAHRSRFRVWGAVFMPCAWLHAQKRANYVRPDHLLALGWRPGFRRAANGSLPTSNQDFMWAMLEPEPCPTTTWQRIDKPRLAQCVSCGVLDGELHLLTCTKRLGGLT